MAQVKFSFGMKDADVVAGIKSVQNRHKSLFEDIQKLAVSIIHAFHQSGDGQTAALRANALVTAIANGKQNSLRRWFETHAPFVYNKETKLLVVGFSASSPVKNYKDIDALAARADNWFDSIPDPEYKPIADWTAQIAQLVKRGVADLERMGDKSKVDKGQLAALQALLDAKAANGMAA